MRVYLGLALLLLLSPIFPSFALDIEGRVEFQDCDGPATGVSGVVVNASNGFSTTTGANGDFLLTGFPEGDFELTFIRSGLSIPNATVRLAGSSGLSGLIVPALEEVLSPLPNPTFSLWNGFLGLTNILELVGNVELFDISGQLASTTPFQIAPFGQAGQGLPVGQLDIVLNTIQGFAPDTFGVIRISYSGDLDGRLTYYRGQDFANDLEFVFGLPFNTPSAGPTSVSFNTNRPSVTPNVIFNFLSIVNLDSVARGYTIERFDFFGNLISTEGVTVPPFGRVDVDGGHVNPGPDQIGLINITPASNTAPYIALIIRYGATDQTGLAYDFAFPLVAKAPAAGTLFAPLASRFGGISFLELVNTSAQPVNVDVKFYNEAGTIVHDVTRNLAPHAQIHEFVNAPLGENTFGLAEIQSSVPGTIIAQAMNYLSRPSDGRLRSLYGSQAREALGPRQLGSYNLFIGMNNFLRVFNTGNSSVDITNSVDTTGLLSTPAPRTLAPRASVEFNLHDTTQNSTSPDTYGLFELQASCSTFFIAEVVRQRNEPSGDLDFATPTEVR